jgi:hypothetical protein
VGGVLRSLRDPHTSRDNIGAVTFDENFFKDQPRKDANTLINRAWCYQEIKLSCHLLSFGQLQMSFACLREGLFESRDEHDPIGREERNFFLSRFQEPLAASDNRRAQQLLNTWYDLLGDYSKRLLTFPDNKLVAISRIANIIGEYFQLDYCARLWHE